MTIARDTETVATAYTSTGTQTTSHGGASSTKAVVVLIDQNGATADEVSGVTYGGTAMLRLDSNSEATEAGRTYTYYLLNPPTGTQNVAMTTTAATNKQLVCATMTGDPLKAIKVAGFNFGTSAGASNPSWTISGLTAGTVLEAYEVIHSGLQTMTNTPQSPWTLISSTDLGSQGRGFARQSVASSGTTLSSGWTAATSEDFVGQSVAFYEDWNLVPNENSSFEGGTTGTWESNGIYTVGTLSNSATHADVGTKALLMTWPTTGSGSIADVDVLGMVDGQKYNLVGRIWVPSGDPDVRAEVIFFGAGSYVSTKDAFADASVTFTANSALHALCGFQAATATSGDQVWIDNVRVYALIAVSTTRATTWDVLTPVSTTRATTWDVLAPVSTTRATTWKVRAQVSTTRVASWDTRAQVSTTRATTWDVLTPVSATRATTWKVRAQVSTTRATTWDTLAQVSTTRATTWNVAAAGGTPVSTTRATTWDVLAQVSTTRATTWKVRAQVSTTRATTWDVLGQVSATRATTWDVLSAVSTTRATTWRVRASVSATRATTWRVRATVTATRATTWDVLAAVSTTRSTTWDTLAQVSTTRATTWNVASSLTPVSTTRATTWRVVAQVATTRAVTWDVRTVASTTRATTWDVLTSASATRATTWKVRAQVASTRATIWRVRSQVAGSRVTTWDVLAQVTPATRATTWRVLGLATTTRGTTWNVLSSAYEPAIIPRAAILSGNSAVANTSHSSGSDLDAATFRATVTSSNSKVTVL